MKPPPFLLGSALLFWGWQTNLPVAGAVLAVALEGGRLLKARWELSNDDFSRIWTFCTLLFLASAAYAFTSNEGPSSFQGLFQEPTLRHQRNVGISTARTAASLIRWTPMVFFLFVGAQVFSSREGIPLETISLILRRRWKKALKLGQPLPPSVTVDIGYPYFALCLLAASSHAGESTTFFWGLCALLGWALWSQRSPRFGMPIWASVLVAAIVLGYLGQGGLSRLRSYLETLNPQWLSSFTRRGADPNQSKTQLGQIGRIKTSTKIVIRVQPKEHSLAPTLLREASYRGYSNKGQTWNVGDSRNDFENLLPETNNTFILVPEKTNPAAVNISCYLHGGQGLLPLPLGCGRLENLPAYVLHKNSSGAVLAEGPGLVVFDARFGPGATIDANPGTNAESSDFAIPSHEIPALDQVISELRLTRQMPEQEVLHSINGFFQAKFNYSVWQERDRLTTKTNDTPLSRFLLRTRSGHCEFFATATVLLLRRLGIPARYAVGYAVHETSGRGYVVRLRDAHAWCLVWNRSTGLWEDFDTTPASWVEAESNRASPLLWLSDAWSRITFEISKLRWGQTHLRQYLLWATIPVLALLLAQIFFRRRRRRLGQQQKAPGSASHWPGLDSEFYQLEKTLTQRGLARAPSEPLSAWLRRATADPLLSQINIPARELLNLHYRYRFDPQGINSSDRATLHRETKVWLERIQES